MNTQRAWPYPAGTVRKVRGNLPQEVADMVWQRIPEGDEGLQVMAYLRISVAHVYATGVDNEGRKYFAAWVDAARGNIAFRSWGIGVTCNQRTGVMITPCPGYGNTAPAPAAYRHDGFNDRLIVGETGIYWRVSIGDDNGVTTERGPNQHAVGYGPAWYGENLPHAKVLQRRHSAEAWSHTFAHLCYDGPPCRWVSTGMDNQLPEPWFRLYHERMIARAASNDVFWRDEVVA
jgi:hypothetical protein